MHQRFDLISNELSEGLPVLISEETIHSLKLLKNVTNDFVIPFSMLKRKEGNQTFFYNQKSFPRPHQNDLESLICNDQMITINKGDSNNASQFPILRLCIVQIDVIAVQPTLRQRRVYSSRKIKTTSLLLLV